MARRKRRSTSRVKRKKSWNPIRHPGSLKKLGYDPDDKGAIARHRALAKAVKRYGYTRTVKKLSFLAGAARVNPVAKANAQADLEWLKEKYGKKRRRR